ncbi:MAG: hypothetical protein JSR66_07165 [Proteobacteria bacterium]|nr:hypothetical protein [Pseudomonadota bacterium]
MSSKKHSGRRWIAAATLASVLAVSVMSGPASAVEPWPHIDEPPKGSVQWVARSMMVNGVPTSVMQFNSPLSLQQIADYYKSRWSQGYDHPPSVHHVGDATVVGQMHGSYLMTVKVSATPNGGSQGLLSVAQVLGSKADRDPGVVPVISGAHVLSVVESQDAGQHSRQVLILATQSPAAVADYYQAALTNSGWRQVQGNESTPPASLGAATSSAGSFLAFSQNDQEIQISIAGSKQGRGTSVLANVITHGAGEVAQ